MDRIKFFLAGIKADRHLDISWIINVYNLCQYPYSDELLDFKPYDIAQDRDNGHRVYFDPEEKSFKPIMGIKPLEPIIGYKEKYNEGNSFKIVEEKKTKYVGNTPLKRNNNIEKSKNKVVKAPSMKVNNNFRNNSYNKNSYSIILCIFS